MKHQIIAILVSLMSGSVVAATADCKTGHVLTGRCFDINGTILFTGDSGPVLDSQGQRFYISDKPNSLPETVERALSADSLIEVRGNYEACPEPDGVNQFGATHVVCINSARDLSVTHVTRSQISR
jgi:hypothetical protein